MKLAARALAIAQWSRPSLVLLENENGLHEAETGGLYHGGWAYQREAFERVRGYGPLNNGEDQEFAARLTSSGTTVVDPSKLADPFYFYRVDNGSYLADDDHGPLALAEILLAGCPVVGVRTGAPFIEHGVTGYFVERLPPGESCLTSSQEFECLERFEAALDRAASIDRESVARLSTTRFLCDQTIDRISDILKIPVAPADKSLSGTVLSDFGTSTS